MREALHDWDALPVEGGYLWRPITPVDRRAGLPAAAGRRDLVLGGLICDVAVGATPDDMIIGTRDGALYRSRDRGATWLACGDGLPGLETIAVARGGGGAGTPVILAGAA